MHARQGLPCRGALDMHAREGGHAAGTAPRLVYSMEDKTYRRIGEGQISGW
jgi:hypothetical protein